MKLIFFFVLLVACQTTNESEQATAQELFSKAETQSRRGNYLEAVETLSKLKYLYPYSEFGVQTDLLKADIAFKQSEWKRAEKFYQNFRVLYPFHEKKEYAHLRQILSLDHQISKIAVRDISLSESILKLITLFEKAFPKSQYREQVLEIKTEIYNRQAEKEYRIASFYLKKKKYQAALKRLDQVFKNYQKSNWVLLSAQMGLKIAEILQDEKLKEKYSKEI